MCRSRTPSATLSLVLLGHQGGWDEILFVAGPMLVVGLVLAVANRRAARVAAEREAAEHDAADTPQP